MASQQDSLGAVTSYSYDQNGNQTLINANGARTSYAWDGENRLAQVVQPDGTVEKSEYSHEGLRRKKQKTDANNVTTTQNLVWDAMSLVQVRNESNLLLANYTWAPETWGGFWSGGELMDVLLLERNASTAGDMVGGVSRYHGEDPSYNTRLLIEPNGNVSDRFSYRAFGEVWNHLGGGMSPLLFGGALGYWFDALRRIQARYRVVDPKTGKWIKPDEIGFYGGNWNLFGYAGNDPVNEVDPSGLRSGSAGTRRQRTPVVPSSKTCGANNSRVATAVRDFCHTLKTQQNCVAKCLVDNGFSRRLRCLQNWCRRPQYHCSDKNCRPGNCAQTLEKNGVNIDVQICSLFFADPGCYARIGDLFAHEVLHGCGYRGESSTGSSDDTEDMRKRHKAIYKADDCIWRCRRSCPNIIGFRGEIVTNVIVDERGRMIRVPPPPIRRRR